MLFRSVGLVVDKFSSIASTAVAVWQWVSGAFQSIVDFVTGIPDKIATAASGMWDGIKEAFKGVINWIIDAWNGISFTFPSFTMPSWLGGGTVGGWTLAVPKIPRLHSGGIFDSGMGEGLALLKDGETVRTTAQEAALGTGGTTIELHFHGPVAQDSVRWVTDQVEQAVAQDRKSVV